MSDFAKMDIFFVVATLAVVAFITMLAFVLFRVWRILGHVEDISREISQESTLVRADIAGLRSQVKENGFHMRFVGAFFRDIFHRVFMSKKRK